MIRWMKKYDLAAAADIHQQAFPLQQYSAAWLKCSLEASPRHMIFVAEHEHQVIGYINWVQKKGFRRQALLELEQLAVLPYKQNQGIGTQLIKKSLELVQAQLANQGSLINQITLTTSSNHKAQKLYRETLGAEVESILLEPYATEEVVMVARNVAA